MDLEMRVSQAVLRVRQIERAIHDPGPWTVVCGSQVAPAVRMIASDSVTIRAHFPEMCWITDGTVTMSLCCKGEVVSVREVAIPEDGEFNIEWTYRLPEMVHAS